jgi:hypothetical protein
LRSVRHPASTTARSAASPTRGASRSYSSGPRRPPLARVTQAERRELRFAVSNAAGSESAIAGGSVRALFEQRLLPLASGVDAAFVAVWRLNTVRSVMTPCSLFDCLVDRNQLESLPPELGLLTNLKTLNVLSVHFALS